ncbi:MAG: MFS transporter [Gammaproteobacteria bacterium]|nr:MFS transporter [Gammaproteobacteria bacterium]
MLTFFRKTPAAPVVRDMSDPEVAADLRRRQWAVFFAITVGYGFYYVCRLSFSVAKKPMADAGIFDTAEMGIIGSALFFAYAFGKLANGILADRVNVRRFMAMGLFISALINLVLGFTTAFWAFLILWGFNGWFQAFGAGSSVVTITHWYSGKERGTFYGMWASSHNIGEAITFIGTAFVITSFGWMWGFRVAGAVCILMSLFILRFLFERPDVYGLPVVTKPEPPELAGLSTSRKQWQVVTNPAVWILAVSSACFYVTRYAVNSWGIFFLEAEKGYTTIEASSIVSANAIAGIFGTFFSGILSDRFFSGRRNLPALVFGVIYALAIALFVLGPADPIVDTLAMVFFGVALGVLMVYLGGLMAVDICSKEVSGSVLGIVGLASYIGAGLQDIISGQLIDAGKTVVNGETIYNFDAAGALWIGSAVVSLLLAILVWNVRSPD